MDGIEAVAAAELSAKPVEALEVVQSDLECAPAF
jgi:hypothetical protein